MDTQNRAKDAFHRFEDNPQHPSLRFRQVHPTRPIYSARVSLGYRALAVQGGDDWVWFWIGSHADYDTLLQRM
jgi:hypothetical protein